MSPGVEHDGTAASGEEPIVHCRAVVRRFGDGEGAVTALDGVDLAVPRGRMVALHGRSGSGKTTLLNIVGGLDLPDEGTARVCGLELVGSRRAERVLLRRDHVAFVFQAFGLLPVLSAAENVEVPLRLRRVGRDARRARVAELLDLVGLGQRAAHRPGELSGGEQQRVAIARALVNEPELLVADEPTGQLDSVTGRRIMDLLRHLVDTAGLAVVVATHDPTLLDVADTTLQLRDGRLAAGTYGQRFSGDVDRSRVLSTSVVLPAPPVDPDAPFRAPPGEHVPEHVPADGAVPAGDPERAASAATVTPPHVRPRHGTAAGRGAADGSPPRLRFGPDGELLPDEG